MTNYLRTCYRITGDSIDSASLAVAAGSSATSAANQKIGSVEVAHGLSTTPTFAIASPLCADTLVTLGRKVKPIGLGATYCSFITASAVIVASLAATEVTSALSSKVVMTFVWAAFG